MPLKNFIKENFVLVVGLTLPVLLVVLFFVASALPRSLATPPQYEILFTQATDYNEDKQWPYNVDFFVDGSTIKAHIWKYAQRGSVNQKKLMVYNAKKQSIRELPYDLSKIGKVPENTVIVFDEFKNMKVDTNRKAPDGYEFDDSTYDHGGIITDLFAGGYGYTAPRLTKGAAVYKIPADDDNYNTHNAQFLGWIVQK